MARKHQIALMSVAAVAGVLATALWSAYFALQQVRPFYHQALALNQQVLEQGSRDLESRATALYSDTRVAGPWQALFTANQVNGWLAIQLAKNGVEGFPAAIRDPRVAIAPDLLTLGFRTSLGGMETVISVDASVFLTEEGAVAIRLMSVRAGKLPLPVLQVADEIAVGCRKLRLPVQWTQQDGRPVAIVEISQDDSMGKRRLYLDAITLNEGELFVAGHTEIGNAAAAAEEQLPAEPEANHGTTNTTRSAGN